MRLRAWLCVGILTILAGCQAKLDGSSPEALKASIEKVMASVPSERRAALGQDINMLAPVTVAMFVTNLNGADGRRMFQEAAGSLDGLTVDKIRAKASAMRAEREAAQTSRILALAGNDVKQAQALVDKSRKAIERLKKFKIVSFEPGVTAGEAAGTAETRIEVTNGTDVPIDGVEWIIAYAGGPGAPGWSRLATSGYPSALSAGETRKVVVAIDVPTTFGSVGVDLSQVKIVGVSIQSVSSNGEMADDRDEANLPDWEQRLKRAEANLAELKAAHPG